MLKSSTLLLQNIIEEEIEQTLFDHPHLRIHILEQQQQPPQASPAPAAAAAPATPTPPADPSSSAPNPAEPPADAAAGTPPADPDEEAVDADGGGEDDSETDDSDEDSSDPVIDMIKALASKTPVDIKKTILSDLQNGAKRLDAEKLMAQVDQEIQSGKTVEDEDAAAPDNVRSVVKNIEKTFRFKVPDKLAGESESEVVQESGLQTSVREYLHYKRLLEKVRG